MSNVFEYVNADGLGDFGYPGNWFDVTSPTAPFPFGPPGPTDVALVETSGTITGTGNVSTLVLVGAGGLLTSTLQFTTQVLILEGTLALSDRDYSEITNEVEEAGASTVTLTGGELYIDNPTAGPSGSTVFDVGVSSGDQSTFNLAGSGTEVLLQAGDAIIGDAGSGAMTISSGAVLESLGDVTFGNQVGSQGSLTVTGESSSLIAGGTLLVADYGESTLSILSGGLVKCYHLTTAEQEGASGSVLVSGAGSELISTLAFIGSERPGSSLTIADGGFAEINDLYIGEYSGGTVLVEGTGSMLEINGGLGWDNPTNASLEVTSGAQVVLQTAGPVYLAAIMANVSISVSGAASIFRSTTGTLDLGAVGGGAETVTIGSGGKMITSSTGGPAVAVGYTSTQDKTVVTINGTGSNWTVTGEFDVGFAGSLLVESGGGIETGNYDGIAGFVVGNQTGSAGVATITGPASTLINNGKFVIGMYGSGTLAVSSGGVVSTTAIATDGAILGEYAGSIGAVSVSGGSKWTIYPDLVIGAYGTGSLDINAGSTVTAASLMMGITGAGYIDVSGTGAKLTVSGNAQFGNAGSASVIINSGGEVSARGTVALVDGYVSMYGGTLFVSKTLTLDAGQAFGGHGTVQASSTINSTTVQAGSGTLSFIGGITGTGTLQIDVGGTLSLSSSVGSGQHTIFESATSNLVLGAPALFASTIYDFIKGDTIDLSKIIASSLTYNGQTLTVHESGGASLALKFAGSYTQSSFGMTSDGHSGTFLTHT